MAATVSIAASVAARAPPVPEAVRAIVARGRTGGTYYVSELTGFPFVNGLARIHRVETGGRRRDAVRQRSDQRHRPGADEDGKNVYAVQISDEGLLNGPIGWLVRVLPGGGSELVVGGLFAPYGLALKDDAAYVTTCSVCVGGGEVIRIDLPGHHD